MGRSNANDRLRSLKENAEKAGMSLEKGPLNIEERFSTYRLCGGGHDLIFRPTRKGLNQAFQLLRDHRNSLPT